MSSCIEITPRPFVDSNFYQPLNSRLMKEAFQRAELSMRFFEVTGNIGPRGILAPSGFMGKIPGYHRRPMNIGINSMFVRFVCAFEDSPVTVGKASADDAETRRIGNSLGSSLRPFSLLTSFSSDVRADTTRQD